MPYTLTDARPYPKKKHLPIPENRTDARRRAGDEQMPLGWMGRILLGAYGFFLRPTELEL
jgi:hypothetical protein